MTRWYTIHATQGVTLARNVGFLSIGHGYYLEDGSETGNKLYANLGVLARAGIQNPQNPRNVPGIFAAAHSMPAPTKFRFTPTSIIPPRSGSRTAITISSTTWPPAPGPAACAIGCCPAPTAAIRVTSTGTPTPASSSICGNAHGVDLLNQAGITPLYKFVGNSCSTAQNSFNTIGNSTPCSLAPANGDIQPIINPLSPAFPSDPTAQAFSPQADAYYPKVAGSGFRQATQCPASGSCATVSPCSYNSTLNTAPSNCMITAIDHYTTSFNWAQTNYGAIWLRSQWYLFTNSAVTDVTAPD